MKPVLRSQLEAFAKGRLVWNNGTVELVEEGPNKYSIVWTDAIGKAASIDFYFNDNTIVWTFFEERPGVEDQGLLASVHREFPVWAKAQGIEQTAIDAVVHPRLETILRLYGYEDDPTGRYRLVSKPDLVQATADWLDGKAPRPPHARP